MTSHTYRTTWHHTLIEPNENTDLKNSKDELEESEKDSTEENLEQKMSNEIKEQVGKCKSTNSVTPTTVTSSSSIVSVLESPSGSSHIKPVATTGNFVLIIN